MGSCVFSVDAALDPQGRVASKKGLEAQRTGFERTTLFKSAAIHPHEPPHQHHLGVFLGIGIQHLEVLPGRIQIPGVPSQTQGPRHTYPINGIGRIAITLMLKGRPSRFRGPRPIRFGHGQEYQGTDLHHAGVLHRREPLCPLAGTLPDGAAVGHP